MYCSECGSKLTTKFVKLDGDIPYCPNCDKLFFPQFNSAVSCVIFNQHKDKILLIQQYGKTNNILVAGYIAKGENAKQALVREIKEEVNLDVDYFYYNDNEYYSKSNTLIHNYMVVVKNEDFTLTDEVDKATWFSLEEAKRSVLHNSLAESFLLKALDKISMLEHKD